MKLKLRDGQTVELKPCAFCGGSNLREKDRIVGGPGPDLEQVIECMDCGASASDYYWHAAEKWNMRS